ncbi:Holliday junction branch migration protein RuvA [Candidatus Berkelbacteria bacterium]|nr:Holliday junction branch migration protein RuvA [Candidatus Berkelbacteria bacterium]
MIRLIAGTVAALVGEGVVVDVGGLGYLVRVPIRSLAAVGSQVRYHTYHHIREDGQALYGFQTPEELEIFTQLLDVPSIGPKLALTILTSATPAEIAQAIAAENVGFFQSLPGVGKKSAAKIIVELRGRSLGSAGAGAPGRGSDLAEALASLGYGAAEIQRVTQVLPADLTSPEAQVTWALRALAGSR